MPPPISPHLAVSCLILSHRCLRVQGDIHTLPWKCGVHCPCPQALGTHGDPTCSLCVFATHNPSRRQGSSARTLGSPMPLCSGGLSWGCMNWGWQGTALGRTTQG